MLDKLIGPVTGLLDKFIEDKDQKALLAHEVATMAENHAQNIALGFNLRGDPYVGTFAFLD